MKFFSVKKTTILLIVLLICAKSNAQYRQFDKHELVKRSDTLKTKSDFCTDEMASLKRTTSEKVYAVAFYTIFGATVGLITAAVTNNGHDYGIAGLGSLMNCSLYGAGVGMTTGILVVTFNLDKPFRKKVKHKKKRSQ